MKNKTNKTKNSKESTNKRSLSKPKAIEYPYANDTMFGLDRLHPLHKEPQVLISQASP